MKPEKVVFADSELEKSFNEIKESDPLKKSLIRAIKEIQENCFCGRNVKKELIPKKLIDKYQINNLWIYNLQSAWRLFYSITSTREIEIIAAVLDWMDHKDYERLFGF
jgi:hypothetical protein